MTWAPWVEGVEQTAILTLTSPPEGPSLLSGFGDIRGWFGIHRDDTGAVDYARSGQELGVGSGAIA